VSPRPGTLAHALVPALLAPALLALGLFSPACHASAPPSPGRTPSVRVEPTRSEPGVSPPTVPAGRVAVIVMENKEYDQVIGSPGAPYLNALASRSVLLTESFAVTHPSLPNYLALIGGSTFGIDSDCTSCSVDGRSLVDQLDEQGIGWRAYMEGMPGPCFLGARAGAYAKKHDPFVYLQSVAGDPGRCANVVPFDRLPGDLSAGLAPFVWITPDLCHDMHNCSVEVGDRWLSEWVPRVLAALGPNGILVLTFDEGDSGAGCCGVARGGHIATVIAGPGAGSGVRVGTPVDHYSILRLIEDHFGLPRLGQAGAPATPSIAGWQR
jgi:hypothetical protein